MANYGTFVYGSGVVYGPSGGEVSSLDIISKEIIKVNLVNNVITDSAYFDLSNYTLEFSDDPGNVDVAIRKILVPYDGEGEESLSVGFIFVQTQAMTEGTKYSLSIDGLSREDGTAFSSSFGERKITRTKTDLLVQSLPSHFDRTPTSIVRNVLTAIGIEDNRIGGSFKDEL